MNRAGVSILISTYNGELRLESTLNALAKLDTLGIPFIELILVDNASTDNSLEFSKSIWEKLGNPFQAVFLSESTPGKLFAQEKGLKIVKGKYVLICDDDNALLPDYLQLGYKYMEMNSRIGVIGGRGIGLSKIEFPGWFEEYSYFYGCAPQAPKTGNVRPVRNVVYGAGMWFRQEVYLKAKELGYQFILGSREGNKLITGAEDSELCWMLIYQGYEVWYIDEMRFYHHITENRLTEKYRAKLIKGMAENGLNGTIHYRVWQGLINKRVQFFWLKESIYTFIYILFLPFNKAVQNNKWEDFKRALNNIKLLLTQRNKYDHKVNALLLFKAQCAINIIK